MRGFFFFGPVRNGLARGRNEDILAPMLTANGRIVMAKLSPSIEIISSECVCEQAGGSSIPENANGLLLEHAAASEYPEGFMKLNGSLRDVDLVCPVDDIPEPVEPVM